MVTLPPEDAKVRFELVKAANEVLVKEGLETLFLSSEELLDFILQWNVSDGVRTKEARALLSRYLDEEKCTVLEWVKKSYSYDKLYLLYEFSIYCGWLGAKEIIDHFGLTLNVFYSLYGKVPSWCNVPFHLVLRVAYVEVWKVYRSQTIRKWLDENWEEAGKLLGQNIGVPSDDFPHIQGVEWHHVQTIYRHMLDERTRKYLRESKK
jgi:hypothetical protein